MIRNTKEPFFSALLSLVFLFFTNGCVRPPDFPLSPEISFNNIVFRQGQRGSVINFTPDTIRLSFNYTDGDGDLGLNLGDTLPPFNRLNPDRTPNRNHFNIFVDYFEQNNQGGFDSVPLSISFNGRFPLLMPKNESGPIRGTFDYNIQSNDFPRGRQVFFKIQIQDRALRSSNRISTTPFLIPR